MDNKTISLSLTILTAISFSHLRSSKIPALFMTMSISSIKFKASSKAAIIFTKIL